MYEGCPESVRPYWISPEAVSWPWCNLAASQRRPYCASMNSHSPVGLVSRQWDAVDWACVLCDRRIHNDRPSRSAPSRQCACPFYSSRAGFFAKHHITQVSQPTCSPEFAPCDFCLFPKLKSPLKRRRLVNATVTQYTSSVNGISLSTDWLHGRVIVHGCIVSSLPTGCQFTSKPRDRFSRYSRWPDTFRTAFVHRFSVDFIC